MVMNKNVAFVFPGQGSQVEGMLSDCAHLPSIQTTLAEANEALGYDLASIILNGTKVELDRTEITQPALLTVSTALWRLWCEQSEIRPILLAGHSLGEYSALVASNAINFSDAVRLVSLRGQYMQEAVPVGSGGMAAILGLDDASVIQICEEVAEGEVLSAVNFNSPGQVVIAGTKEAVDRGCILAKERGARRALPLPVSAPSHCALMKPAAERLAIKLQEINMITPSLPIIHNVDVSVHNKVDEVIRALTEQLYQPVRWTETIQEMSHRDITHVIECGPGKVLAGLIKRIDKTLNVANVFDHNSLEQTVSMLEE